MDYCVEVTVREGAHDARAQTLASQIEQLGVDRVEWVGVADRYYLQGEITALEVEHLAAELLHDPIVEIAITFPLAEDTSSTEDGVHTIDVVLHPGVTDSAAESLLAGAREMGITTIESAASGNRYTLGGSLDRTALEEIATSLLANEVIENYYIDRPAPPPQVAEQAGTPRPVERVPLAGLTGEQLLDVSRERRLSLDDAEMAAIQTRFAELERDPTDVELEMLAQTWSEHCIHKTFRAEIEYTGPPPGAVAPITTTLVDSILKSHIRAATEALDRPWVKSAFVDDAGIGHLISSSPVDVHAQVAGEIAASVYTWTVSSLSGSDLAEVVEAFRTGNKEGIQVDHSRSPVEDETWLDICSCLAPLHVAVG